MSDDHEWGPWIEHDGLTRPVPFGTYLHVRTKSGREQFGRLNDGGDGSSYFEWHVVLFRIGTYDDCIVRYRIRKPLGLTMLENIAQGVDAPQGVNT